MHFWQNLKMLIAQCLGRVSLCMNLFIFMDSQENA